MQPGMFFRGRDDNPSQVEAFLNGVQRQSLLVESLGDIPKPLFSRHTKQRDEENLYLKRTTIQRSKDEGKSNLLG